MEKTQSDKLFNALFGGANKVNPSEFDFGEFLNGGTSSVTASGYDWKRAYLSMKDDFDSYRKRMDIAKSTEKKNLTKEIIRGLLDVVEFALFTYNAKNKMGTYTKEDEMILDKLSAFLKTYDVHPMKDPVGLQFDHNFHEAVMTDESGMFESGTVSLCLSHGYMFGDEVLRYAKVVVAK